MPQSTTRRSALVWSTIVLAAIAIGLYAQAPQMSGGPGAGRVFPRIPGPPPDLPTLLYMLGVGSVVWYALAIALPFLLWAARSVGGRVRAIALAIGAIVGLFAVTTIVQFVATYSGAPSAPSASAYLPIALRQNLLPWIALVGVVAAVEARRRARVSTLEHERLRALVAEQRLIALTGQLHPHFLFNTLQGISTLIHRDAEAADEMLGKLSDLLRDLLRHRDHVLVPLGDEIRYARTYLEISQLRFADRLTFDIDVPSALHEASVPLFLLQPLVENALAHGIGGRASGGHIVLSAQRRGHRLMLEVVDDGAGLRSDASSTREGIGLGNTRERLRASFGDDQRLVLEPAPGGGTIARVDIPYLVAS